MLGRKAGTISEEVDKDYINMHMTEKKTKTPSEKEDICLYNETMKGQRLRYLSISEAVQQKKASHKFLVEAAKAKEGNGRAKLLSLKKIAPPRRMLRITSEISGLSADLPVHWASGIFVCIDEDRPDIMKACIMAVSTVYQSGFSSFGTSFQQKI